MSVFAAIFLSCCLPGFLQADTLPPNPLTTIAAVRRLSPSESVTRIPVDVTGVVTLYDSEVPDLFVQDEVSGIYLMATSIPGGLRPGDRVRVLGTTDIGWFSPIISATRIEVMEHAEVPIPMPFDFSQSAARWLDATFVQSFCLVREVDQAVDKSRLLVEGHGGEGFLEFPKATTKSELLRFVGCVVRVRGICGPEFDVHGRTTGKIRILLQSVDAVVALETSRNAADLPIRTAMSLKQFLPGVSPVPIVRMSGVVTGLTATGRLLVQDSSGGFGVRIRDRNRPSVSVGTEITVSGFLTITADRVEVHSADITAGKLVDLPRAVPVHTPEEFVSADGCRAEIEGTVTEATPQRLTVTGDFGTVVVPDAALRPLTVSPGSRIRVAGTAAVRPDAGAGFRLLSVADNGIRVLSQAPRNIVSPAQLVWLLIVMLTIVAVVVIAASVWVMILRQAVRRRTRELSDVNASLEQRIRARTVELGAANRELEAFCYSVSHDLRAPLRSIDGFSRALQEDYAEKLDAEARDFLNRVRAAAGRMGELIDDLLNLSRVTRAELSCETFSITALAEEVIQELRNSSESARHVDVSVVPNLTVTGDRSLIRILLSNLLGNAWKYTQKTETPRIQFGCQAVGDTSVFFVRDNGAGFDPEYHHKLFQPFQRLHRADEFPGHGIGLATVLRIVRRHGGQAGADGTPGQGATFWFTLTNHLGARNELDVRHTAG